MANVSGLLLLLLSAAALAAPEPGLYQVALTGEATALGDYRSPSIDPVGRLLYAVDPKGALVRWPLDSVGGAPETFAAAGDPPYLGVMAAPEGGQVAAIRIYPVKQGTKVLYRRVALEVFTTAGVKLAGPLPLFRAEQLLSPQLAAVWHPDGEKLAFCLTEGNSRPGLYVFFPASRNWVLAQPFVTPPAPLPQLQWQPNGRSLSLIADGSLVLRGGGHYAVYRAWPVTAARHLWLGSDVVAALDPAGESRLYTIAGQPCGGLPAWRGSSPDAVGLPAAGAQGLAWVGAGATTGEETLWLMPKGEAAATALLSWPAGALAAGRRNAPAWRLDEPAIYLEVPSPPAARPAAPAPSSAGGRPTTGR